MGMLGGQPRRPSRASSVLAKRCNWNQAQFLIGWICSWEGCVSPEDRLGLLNVSIETRLFLFFDDLRGCVDVCLTRLWTPNQGGGWSSQSAFQAERSFLPFITWVFATSNVLPLVKYFGPKNLSEALNAYNMRRADRQHRAWAWIDDRMLKVPHFNVNINNNEKMSPSSAKPGENSALYWDLYHPWASLATWPVRALSGAPAAPKYRLAVFIHKHTPRRASGTVKKIETVYSVSIWDREVGLPCIPHINQESVLTWVQRTMSSAGTTLGRLATRPSDVRTSKPTGPTAGPIGNSTPNRMWTSVPSFRSPTPTTLSPPCRDVRPERWSRDSLTGLA